MTREKLSRSSLLCCIICLSEWLSRWCSRFLPLYIFKKSRRLRDGRSPIQSTTIREKVSTRKMFSFWLTTTFLEINLKLINKKIKIKICVINWLDSLSWPLYGFNFLSLSLIMTIPPKTASYWQGLVNPSPYLVCGLHYNIARE
jgi:hypothetical protein